MENAWIYTSSPAAADKKFQLASGYISTTRIFFENEGIVAVIQAEGKVEFLTAQEVSLAMADIPAQTGGRQVYEDVHCRVSDGRIVLDFPIYRWIDNYPHCDGEHDRWDTVQIGSYTVRFDLKTHTVTTEA